VLFAYEAAPASGGGNIWGTVGMFAVLFGLMYLMFIRPQSKRRKEALKMQSEIGPGDKVITIGGLHGRVTTADDKTITIEAAPGVELTFERPAIARIAPPPVAAEAEPDTSVDEPVSPIQESKKKV
jgi:preprotein translocase subunit YajC